MALINLQNVSLTYNRFPLFDNISLQIHEGEKISLLGRNGSGKSTMMKLINNAIQPDSGQVIREKDLKTALLIQDVPRDVTGTVYSIIAGGIPGFNENHESMDPHDEKKHRIEIEKTISLLSIDPDLEFQNLSAGMKRRVLLGKTLVNSPDILLMDEPTNHLDIESIKWLEDFLVRYRKTVFFVTHDRMFMQKIANRILELDRGKIFDWKCDYTTFLERKEAWLDAEETKNELFDKKLEQEEIWIRKGIKARRTRNEGRVRALKRMRNERSQRRERDGKVKIQIQTSDISGKMVIEAHNISFSYNNSNNSKPIIEDFSTRILRGDKIGIIGSNGCGKSTLVKLLLSELTPLSGFINTGTNIDKIYFDQLRNQLDYAKSIRFNVADGNDYIDFNGKRKHVIGYLQDFLFPPDRIDVPVSVLSGGETNRLLLAKLFTKPSNLIIMDEPTNDLDIETVELLEELLLDFEGTVLVVSHDRQFLNNIVTDIIAFEKRGSIKQCSGGYDDYITSNYKSEPEAPLKEKVVKTTDNKPKTKLSFKEKKELESMPEQINDLETKKNEVINLMSLPETYQNGSKIVVLKQELSDIENTLHELYARWEILESMVNN